MTYSIADELGRSHGIATHRAMDRALGRPVLLQVPVADEDAFEARARALAGLRHPAIPQVYALGHLPDGRRFAALAELEGAPLDEAIDVLYTADPDEVRFSLRALVEAIRTVARALAHAHDRHVVHGDLDPECVLIDTDGAVALVDWPLGEPGAGHPAYQAPERFEGAHPRRPPTSTPWGPCSTGSSRATRRTPARPPPCRRLCARRAPRSRHPGRPRAAAAGAVGRVPPGMQRDPAERFASAREVVEALTAWLERRTQRARAATGCGKHGACSRRSASLSAAAAARAALADAVLDAAPHLAPETAKAPAWALQEEAAALRDEMRSVEGAYEQLLEAAVSTIPPSLWPTTLSPSSGAPATRPPRPPSTTTIGWSPRATCGRTPRRCLRCRRRGAGSSSTSRATARWGCRPCPRGAQVWLDRYVLRQRRLVAEPVQRIGHTPLERVPVRMGAYRLRLDALAAIGGDHGAGGPRSARRRWAPSPSPPTDRSSQTRWWCPRGSSWPAATRPPSMGCPSNRCGSRAS